MAFQQPTIYRPSQRVNSHSQETTALPQEPSGFIEQSQEWVLFAPSQAESTTNQRTHALSRVSDLGSLNSAARSAQPHSSVLDEENTEDGDLDSLDDGLHAFREPILYRQHSNQVNAPLLPTHDGLGTFPASSPLVLEQLWIHEQHNPKRKHEGYHRRPSSVQQKLEAVEEFEAQANEEKRIRIEKWRLDQSQALLAEVERETRHQLRKTTMQNSSADALGSTPKQKDFLQPSDEDNVEDEPFWRKITRKFIRDIIGIDEPLLSVILGESLPGESTPRPSSPVNVISSEQDSSDYPVQDTWRNRLLQRIARELGVFVHQISPHPGAFLTYTNSEPVQDYAGIPIKIDAKSKPEPEPSMEHIRDLPMTSNLTPNFPPTLKDPTHAESWGFEDEPAMSTTNPVLNLQQEREYWERELDVKMVFRFLADKFVGRNRRDEPPPSQAQNDASATRVAIIRQHHPLIARTQRSPVRVRRESRISRRGTSSCASESAKGGHRARPLRSGSSRNYWDIGGSVGSGSLAASGAHMGAWGEA